MTKIFFMLSRSELSSLQSFTNFLVSFFISKSECATALFFILSSFKFEYSFANSCSNFLFFLLASILQDEFYNKLFVAFKTLVLLHRNLQLLQHRKIHNLKKSWTSILYSSLEISRWNLFICPKGMTSSKKHL